MISDSALHRFAVGKINQYGLLTDWLHFPKWPNGFDLTALKEGSIRIDGTKQISLYVNTDFTFDVLTSEWLAQFSDLFSVADQKVLLNYPVPTKLADGDRFNIGNGFAWRYSPAIFRDPPAWSRMHGEIYYDCHVKFSQVEWNPKY